MKARPILFIVGVGRSGTSLLQSMLNAHSNVCFLPETQFLRKYLFNNITRHKANRAGHKNFKSVLENDRNFARLNIDAQKCIGETDFSVFNVFSNILVACANRTGKDILGDKDPRNLDFIEPIFNHFPSAYVLHILRDPRDVVLSRTKADWSKKWPFFMHSVLYNTQMIRGRRTARKLNQGQYLEVFYEELIATPERVLNDITDFLKLEYEPSMLNYQTAAKELVSESEMQWKKETLGPLLSNNKEKWKAAFSNYQITLIERICAPALKELPYKLYGKWDTLSLWEKVKIQCAVMFSKIFALIYPLRVKWL